MATGLDSQAIAFLVNLIVIVVFLIVFPIFIILRTSKYFSPRDDGTLPDGKFNFIKPLILMSDEQMIQRCGLDMTIILQLAKLGIIFFTITTIFGIGVILPVDKTAVPSNQNATGFETLSYSNLEKNAPQIWCHWVFTYIFSFLMFYLLDYFNARTIRLKHHYLLNYPSPSEYAIICQNLPVRFRNEKSLSNFMSSIFKDDLLRTDMGYSNPILHKLIKERDETFNKLERATYDVDVLGKKPRQRVRIAGCKWKKVNIVNHYQEQLDHLNEEIVSQQKREKPDSPCAFVTFKSQTIASLASEGFYAEEPFVFDVGPAPEVRDVFWKHLHKTPTFLTIARILVFILTTLLVLFWTIPVFFVSSLTTLSNLVKVLPFLEFIYRSPFLQGFLEGLLPTLALTIFMAVLPLITRKLAKCEYRASKSATERKSFAKLYGFHFWNVFLVITISGAIMDGITDFVNNPTGIVKALATTIPSRAVFFMQFIIFQTFSTRSLQLIRGFTPLIQKLKVKYLAKTKREKEAVTLPPPRLYDADCGPTLLLFDLGIIYSNIAPLILPIILFYFLFTYFVWKYTAVNIFVPPYESKGQVWRIFHNRILVGLFFNHLLTIGVFGLSESPITAALTVPLLVLTIAFTFYQRNKYWDLLKYEPLPFSLEADGVYQKQKPQELVDIEKVLEKGYLNPDYTNGHSNEVELTEVNPPEENTMIQVHQDNETASA